MGLLQQLVAAVAADAAKSVVGLHDAPRAVGHRDDGMQVDDKQQRLVVALHALEPRLGPAPLGDVAADVQETRQGTLGIAQRLYVDVEPDLAAVQRPQRQLDPAALPGRDGRCQFSVRGRAAPAQQGLDGLAHGLHRVEAGQPGEALVDPVDALPAVDRQHGVVGVPHHRRQTLQVGGQALGQCLGARAQRCLLSQQESQGRAEQQAGQCAAHEDDPRRGIVVLRIELRCTLHAQHGVAAGQRQRAFVD